MDSTNITPDKRTFLLKLLLAEALARPGEGPLAPRFSSLRAARPPPPPEQQAEGESGK